MAHQEGCGKWSGASPLHGIDSDLESTGLAVFFLANSLYYAKRDARKECMLKAVKWLEDIQNQDGSFGDCPPEKLSRGHILATLGLLKAFWFTRSRFLWGVTDRALGHLVRLFNGECRIFLDRTRPDFSAESVFWLLMVFDVAKGLGRLEVRRTDRELKFLCKWILGVPTKHKFKNWEEKRRDIILFACKPFAARISMKYEVRNEALNILEETIGTLVDFKELKREELEFYYYLSFAYSFISGSEWRGYLKALEERVKLCPGNWEWAIKKGLMKSHDPLYLGFLYERPWV